MFDSLPKDILRIYREYYQEQDDGQIFKYFVVTGLKYSLFQLVQKGEWDQSSKKRIMTIKKVKIYAAKLTSKPNKDFDEIWNLIERQRGKKQSY